MPDQTRKLAAIVFTDIGGFTEIISKNEPALQGVFQNVKIYSIISHNLPKGTKVIYDTTKNIQIKDRILSRNGLLIFSLIFIFIFLFNNINSKILFLFPLNSLVATTRATK